MTKNFTIKELSSSFIALKNNINNKPPERLLSNLYLTACKLEEIRIAVGNKPIIITSGYRCEELNKAIGGSPTSDHINGLAADFFVPSIPLVSDVVKLIKKNNHIYDQLILYNTFIHVGYGPKKRMQFIDKRK